jgi:uncharacterized Fe-S cluster-containing radical SAM superfamily protein
MTPGPDALARVGLDAFRELWIHTGTACNLSCPFCHEAAAPGDRRLEAPLADEVLPQLDAAAAHGVGRFAFTGGEPLILKDIVRILEHALRLRPCLVLTNGTAPLIRRPHHLQRLAQQPHPLEFRVSIDYPDEKRHDAGRGLKNFRKALQGLALLRAAGFAVGVTRQATPGEDEAEIHQRFRQLFRRHGLPEALPLFALPELGRPLTDLQAFPPPPAPDDSAGHLPPGSACRRSRMLLRTEGRQRFHACPLTDDSPAFDVGDSLGAALQATVATTHPRCRSCRWPGVDYVGAGTGA